MTTLSKSYKGNVYKTSSRGFSTKAISSKLMKFIEKNGTLNSFERAKTGSIYMDFDIDRIDGSYVNYVLRISNHTKRGHSIEWNPKVEINSVKYPDGDVLNYVDFEIIHENGRNEFYNHLGI